MRFLSYLLLGLFASGTAYQLYSLFSIRDFFSRRRKAECAPSRLPPVSIVKPLKGVDPGFGENLRSFCSQEYPEYEVLLGFLESDDGGIRTVREDVLPSLGRGVRLVTSSREPGANRKVTNLEGLVEASRYPVLAISDSDMRVTSGYLRRIMTEYSCEPNVGMVTSLYKVSDPPTLGAALESLTIALDFMPSVLVASRLEGVSFGLGASMLVSKKALEEIGGLRPLADYLADDYQLGNRISRKGYRVVLSRDVLETVVGRMSIRDYVLHQVRWARTNRASRAKGYAGFGITYIIPSALALFALQGPTPLALSVLGIGLLVRFSLAATVYRRVIRSRRWLRWLPLLPVKDIASFGIWAWCFAGNAVIWRGRRYRVLKDGRMKEIPGQRKP